MPTASEILSTAIVIANEWRWLAVSWHLADGCERHRPCGRLAAVEAGSPGSLSRHC